MPEWITIIIRSFLFIVVLFLITKVLGKKQISELTFFEYVGGITIGSIAGEVIMGLENNVMHGIVGIGAVGLITYLSDVISLKSKTLRNILEGKGTILIKDGKILEDNLKKEKYSIDDLSALLRSQQVFKIADVEFAVLEPRGNLSVMLKKDKQPLTPKDLNIKVAKEKEPQTVIMDGSILDEPLSEAQKSRRWLQIELEKLNVTLENVFMAQVDSYGELTIDLYDDKIKVPSPQARPLLLAMLKKCQADLELFSLGTENEKAKKMYAKNAEKLSAILDRLRPYLK